MKLLICSNNNNNNNNNNSNNNNNNNNNKDTTTTTNNNNNNILYSIYSILGSPNEEMWCGVTTLPYWNKDFPIWPVPRNMFSIPLIARLPRIGIELLQVVI